MNLDITCDDFQFENTSISIGNGMACPSNKSVKESSTKAKKDLPADNVALKCEQLPEAFMISSSSSSTLMSGLMAQNYNNCTMKEPLKEVPNISYNLAVAKSIMQQYSSISGDNLFDHLADIIKRVIDERPPNVIDFFEEFSRNVREQKFHLPERFPPEAVFEENRLYKMAKNQLISMKLPYPTNLIIEAEDDLEEERSRPDELSLDLKQEMCKFRTFNDRVQHLQFFWNQCGLSISSEDIYQLACSMDRLQNHPSIVQCRFWGMINGLKASYYIVEASLSKSECESRLLQMEKEIQENRFHHYAINAKNHRIPSHIGPELIPGAVGWENHPEEDILKMTPQVLPVPLMKSAETFDIPPEPIGRGVNRYSYFVVNSLSDEWMELPILTPRQILLSRCIKKFFTGDLEEDIVSYPCFSGKEKHYLRAMIARITSGTYIAPKNYYRKMTKKEKHLFEGVQDSDSEDDEENDEEEEGQTQVGEEEQDEEQAADNDIVLIKNEKYDSSLPINTLNNSEEWVHVRPNILLQGRVVWYNQEKAEQEREKELRRLQDEIDEDDESYDEEAEEQEQLQVHSEIGPAIFTSCAQDVNSETPVPWIRRFTSQFTNRNERIILMQSNVWPGACTFAYKDLCESIYLGWGHKAVARNMTWKHLNPIEKEYTHNVYDFIEATDPSLEIEESYKVSLLQRDLKDEQMQDEHEELESSDDDNDEENEDEDE